MKSFIIVLVLSSSCLGDVSHVLFEYSTTTTSTLPPPPKPYSFQYKAGRYPGHVDRIHEESGDGSGTIYGSYSFVDPKYKVRRIEYVADQNGFHPSLINYEDTLRQPVDSEAVKLAKERHFRLYEKLAEANARDVAINIPRDTASVMKAKDKHLQLYQKIAEEHAAIASQRKAERAAYEATSVINDVNEYQTY
ncbi:cuticle protein 16.8 [Polistes fuscatus]|uniref:cuticle protein 16.8 n=1 Tax=Polistes fuscatus TaxID=30207 RepID=UPI001CA9E2C9|nr:cuticle protein 16.8 [Polistes fuscatus]XP_043494685.1 cuticle protein 16.8 [Polistes fuscatus]XP_043494686.1 cuticle protein 16.8 [Polistes fuscatus]